MANLKQEMTCQTCYKKFYVYKSDLKNRPFKYCSKNCYTNSTDLINKGNRHGMWKGARASYAAIHIWLKNNFTKKSYCEKCGTTSKKIEWSNIDHLYSRNRNDYLCLCTSCHRKSDWNNFNKTKKFCIQCNKEYYAIATNVSKQKFCSKKCKSYYHFIKRSKRKQVSMTYTMSLKRKIRDLTLFDFDKAIKIATLRNQGWTYDAIGESLGLSHQRVMAINKKVSTMTIAELEVCQSIMSKLPIALSK